LWYRTVQAHFETWLALAAESDETAPPAGNDPRWEQAAQPLPAIEFDQRLT
jgi:hypothetical protein